MTNICLECIIFDVPFCEDEVIKVLIDISPILRGETDKMDFSFELESPTDFRDVHFPDKINISGVITNAAGYMTLTAYSDIPFVTHCARCAEEITVIYPLQVERVLALRLEREDNDDYVLVKQNKVDLDEELREELLLGLDFAYYCQEDCKGLCSRCGKKLNDGPCGCNTKEIDPRLANLAKLLDN